MEKTVIVKNITLSVITGMILLTGCGGSSTGGSSTDGTTNIVVAGTEAGKTLSKPQTISETTEVTTTKVAKENCTILSGGTRTRSGSIAGAEVVAYNASGSIIGRSVSSTEGKACFAEAPAKIEVRNAGYDGNVQVQCGGIMDYDLTVDCSSTWGNPTQLIRDKQVFRNLFATLYETMGVPHHVYVKVLDNATDNANQTMTQILDALVGFKWHANGNIDTATTPFTAEVWKSDIIRHALNIYTSNYATEDVQLVALSTIDGLIKMGAYGLADANSPLHDADENFLNSLASNLDQIQRFYTDFKTDIGGIDHIALAVKLLTGDFVFGANGKIEYKEGLELKEGVIASNHMLAQNGPVTNCIHSRDLVCGPRVNVYSIDGLISKSHTGNYGRLLDAETGKVTAIKKQEFYGPLTELSSFAVCDAIDAKTDYNYGVTNIKALCSPAFNKLDLSRNNVITGLAPVFANTQRFLSYTDLGLSKSTNEQFNIMQQHLNNAITIELSPKIDPSMYNTTQEFLTTIAIDMPTGYDDYLSNNKDELEYLTLTFTAVYTIDANGAWTVAIKGQDAVSENTEPPLDDLLGCVKCKDTSNLDGEMKMTARIDKGNGKFETIVSNWYNPTTFTLETRPNGATLLRPLNLISDQFSEVAVDKVSMIKAMLVKNLTNVQGNPELVTASISMVNNTDVRYISYGEGAAEVTDDVTIHQGTIAMRQAEQNAEILKREVKDLANAPISTPLNGVIGMYNVDANLITMLSLGTVELAQFKYLEHDASAEDVATATADAAIATAAAAAELPGAIANITAAVAQVATEATTLVAEATANVAATAANPMASEEAKACAAHKLEEANEVYEKASELGGLGVAQYITACGVGYGTAFHAGGAMVPTTTDATTDAWVECVSTIFADYVEVRVALSDAAELDDDIEVIATHDNDIGDFTTYDVLRTANIFDRITMLNTKLNPSDAELKELSELVDRANFIENPNTMVPTLYALDKGTDVGGFDTPDHNFYEPDTYSIDDLYRRIMKSGAKVNSVLVETKFENCADGCGNN